MSWKKTAAIVIPALALTLGAAGGAQAANLVVNGDFETTTNGPNLQFDSFTVATGWTSTNADHNAYNFIYSPGAADTTGANGDSGNVQLWGPGNGSNNGLTTSPTGGNFVAADGPYHGGAISQTINGLTIGDTYAVGFWWAGAQQKGFTGATQEMWTVSFGSQSQSTALVDNLNHGFTGWMYESFNFTANNTSEVLSFLAYGTPTGVPPFTLLDGVTVNAVPEPSALLLMGGGMLGLGVAGLRRRGKSTTV
ncbi:MAG: PEP-CTERM sorting domain-containing protein [Paludisphaera borealis]|uniref:PEP-CTERM sorting domain-containing protein n=1 Tax=Paludisphaera borealis TaxID=1387353 RepID=UPI0028415BC8|nr:PEP-CTERM sorting domain-containing protein [Paludisphaera borealis]MDR3619752.1 PEP-CTERM sorting domain-containing protein [Paludisphaera borealis]